MDASSRASEHPRRLLVPLDGSPLAEQALPYALTLAGPGSEIMLLRVIPDARAILDAKAIGAGSAEELLRRRRWAALEELVATAALLRQGGTGVRPVVSVAVGDPAEQISRVARDRNVDLIVMTSHGRGAVGRLAFGSVADRVARLAETPVLVTRPKDVVPHPGLPPIQRVVVPLDGSDLAAQAVPVAMGIARRVGVPMLLVSVIDPWRATLPAPTLPAKSSRPSCDEPLEGMARCARKEDIAVETRTMLGPVVPALMAATQPGDVVVMTSHEQTGVKRWLLGDVAEKLVHGSPAPVLLVRGRSAPANGADDAATDGPRVVFRRPLTDRSGRFAQLME